MVWLDVLIFVIFFIGLLDILGLYLFRVKGCSSIVFQKGKKKIPIVLGHPQIVFKEGDRVQIVGLFWVRASLNNLTRFVGRIGKVVMVNKSPNIYKNYFNYFIFFDGGGQEWFLAAEVGAPRQLLLEIPNDRLA